MKEQIEKLIEYYDNLYWEYDSNQYSNPDAVLAKMNMCEEIVSDLKGLLHNIDQKGE